MLMNLRNKILFYGVVALGLFAASRIIKNNSRIQVLNYILAPRFDNTYLWNNERANKYFIS
jgi:hypothetical protein